MNYIDVMTKMRARHAIKSADPMGILGLQCSNVVPSDAERDVEGIMTTCAIDGDDEVVLPGGADMGYFNAAGQRKVFVDHQYDMASLVGVVRWCNPFPNATNPTGLKARIHIYSGLRHPMADDVWERVKQGGLGLSVGFIPLEGGRPNAEEKALYPKAKSVVRRWKMLEVSFVGLPCNVQCQSVPAGPETLTVYPAEALTIRPV